MLPAKIKPMEPVSENLPPGDQAFVHSVKWDGVRAVVFVSSQGVRIQNRNLNDRTAVYPEIHEISQLVTLKEMVFDGEIIVLNKDSRPSFHLVMKRDAVQGEWAAKRAMVSLPVHYMIFDLLYFNGKRVMDMPFLHRLELLNKAIPKVTGTIQVVENEEDGTSLFHRTRVLGLEGVVSKKRDSKYLPGVKSREWVKAKHFKDMDVVVGGFTTRNGRLNSLCVGAYSGDNLLYLGNVSSGLSSLELENLDRELRHLQQPENPFANLPIKNAPWYWVVPALTLKVKYLELTGDGRLRNPVVEGFLTLPPGECRIDLEFYRPDML